MGEKRRRIKVQRGGSLLPAFPLRLFRFSLSYLIFSGGWSLSNARCLISTATMNVNMCGVSQKIKGRIVLYP
ncbi:hypothetical protein F5Y09DRAFT_121819 [Xylaria sp. FL1042]|nr:hypothetical protein F5Y09DRAFT_121819 [Xylaria sp. FL1042]